MIISLKFRIKDNAKKWLIPLSREVNFVWNYVNDLSFYMIKNKSIFLSAYNMHPYLVGATKEELNLRNHTIQEIAETYCSKRNQFRKRKLRYRKSSGSKKSLGWIPFKAGNSIRMDTRFILYGKNKFKIWDSYGIENYKLRSGSFNEDSKGNWYFNICVDTEDLPTTSNKEIGIDLGLKDFAAYSDGNKVEIQQFYRNEEQKLASAQRANKKQRVKSLHKKIQNRRKDFLHKLSTNLIKENSLVVVGNVDSSKLAKTKMAKSVLDAGWSMFRTMLEYKATRRQVKFLVVNEAWTSLTCSGCKNRTGPTGLVGLGIREWTCSECGSVHDRDTNAAINILALGHQRLAEGIQ